MKTRCKITFYSKKEHYYDEFDITIEGKNIYIFDHDGNIQFQGYEKMAGHYEVEAKSGYIGKGTLHRMPTSNRFVGYWIEDAVEYAWVVKII